MLYGVVGTVLLIEGFTALYTHQWNILVGGGLLWVVWLVGRRVYTWGRAWWYRLGLVLLLGMGSGGLLGCESAAREVAKLHGIKVDPFPGPCAPESVQAARCVAVKQGGAQ
jgi:hypothetical protein